MLDYLGIQKEFSFKRKVMSFLDSTEPKKFPIRMVRTMLNFLVYVPRQVVHYHRRKSFEKFYNNHQGDIKKILSIVVDDISREVIKTQIQFFTKFNTASEQGFLKKNGLWEKHNALLDNDEYFPKGVVTLSDDEGFVDCGAFTGDTVEDFCTRTKGKFRHIFSFEADKKNFDELEKTVKKLGLDQKKISCYSKGVYSKNGQCGFSLKGIGSSISDTGDEMIDVVALDSFLNESEKEMITFVKMDIEGAELEALKGMQEIIRKNKPKLAICVYHKPSDFWELPLYIHSLNPDYKLYFRQHALSRTGTVCYAV